MRTARKSASASPARSGRAARTSRRATGAVRELNATAFVDGWFRTGDVAVRDADGFYSIVDRIKDMFISGGENVYPAEVEATIVELDAVGDVAVIGIPDKQWGEVGCAFVVVAPGKQLDVPTLEAHCLSRLAKFKVPTPVRDSRSPAAHAVGQGAEAPAARAFRAARRLSESLRRIRGRVALPAARRSRLERRPR